MRTIKLEIGRCYEVSGITEIGVIDSKDGIVTLGVLGTFSCKRLPGRIRQAAAKTRPLTNRRKSP